MRLSFFRTVILFLALLAPTSCADQVLQDAAGDVRPVASGSTPALDHLDITSVEMRTVVQTNKLEVNVTAQDLKSSARAILEAAGMAGVLPPQIGWQVNWTTGDKEYQLLARMIMDSSPGHYATGRLDAVDPIMDPLLCRQGAVIARGLYGTTPSAQAVGRVDTAAGRISVQVPLLGNAGPPVTSETFDLRSKHLTKIEASVRLTKGEGISCATLEAGEYLDVAQLSTATGDTGTFRIGDGRASAVLTAAATTLDAGPGDRLSFLVEVTNTSPGSSTFSLQGASGANWNVTVSPGSLQLGPGAKSNVTVNATIPAAAASGTGTIVVSALAGAARAGDVSVTVKVVKPERGLRLTAGRSAQTLEAGGQATFTVTVANTGKQSEAITLTVRGDREWASLSKSAFSLASGAETPVSVQVRIPMDAQPGSFTFAVGAAMANSTSAQTVSLVVTVAGARATGTPGGTPLADTPTAESGGDTPAPATAAAVLVALAVARWGLRRR